MSGELEMMAARPNKLLMRVSIPAIGTVEEGYDGKVGWSIDPVAGPVADDGPPALTSAPTKRGSTPRSTGPITSRRCPCVGREELDSRTCIGVKVVTLSRQRTVRVVRAADGLQVGIEATRETPLGIVPTDDHHERLPEVRHS